MPVPAGKSWPANLLEPGSTSVVSDQVWTEFSTIVFFVSDNDPSTLSLTTTPDGFSSFNHIFNIPEDGTVQDVSSFFNVANGSITVQSDITDVTGTPERPCRETYLKCRQWRVSTVPPG